MNIGKKVSVLIVDDSVVVRNALTQILEDDDEIEIMGTAADPYIAASLLKTQVPDVITLDVEMPRMDGLTFLKKLMSQHPIPTVVISSLTIKGSETAIRALEYGAVDVFSKSTINVQKGLEESAIVLRDKVKAACLAKDKLKRRVPKSVKPGVKRPKKLSGSALYVTTDKIIAIGASTGGTEALKDVLQDVPIDAPGILIVQHMPEHFTKQFADRLDELCEIDVREAKDGDSIIRGRALIAPGNKHMRLARSGAKYFVEVFEGPLVNRHRPAVDVLLESVALNAGRNAVGIILTGMGADGSKGLLKMKKAGAYTIAQDEKSSVVFGMPKEAIRINAAQTVLPLKDICPHIFREVFGND